MVGLSINSWTLMHKCWNTKKPPKKTSPTFVFEVENRMGNVPPLINYMPKIKREWRSKIRLRITSSSESQYLIHFEEQISYPSASKTSWCSLRVLAWISSWERDPERLGCGCCWGSRWTSAALIKDSWIFLSGLTSSKVCFWEKHSNEELLLNQPV